MTLAGVPFVSPVVELCVTFAETNSPKDPVLASLLVVVPTMPAVWDGVIVLDAVMAAAASVPLIVGLAEKTRFPVPVAPVEVTPSSNKCPDTAKALLPIVAPPRAKDVPAATPKTGVVSVGLVASATTVPEPLVV